MAESGQIPARDSGSKADVMDGHARADYAGADSSGDFWQAGRDEPEMTAQLSVRSRAESAPGAVARERTDRAWYPIESAWRVRSRGCFRHWRGGADASSMVEPACLLFRLNQCGGYGAVRSATSRRNRRSRSTP